MAASIVQEAGNLLVVTVTDQLRKADLEHIQAASAAAIAEHGKVKALILAEGFQGWERGQDWGDVGFMAAHDRDIETIAVVGEARWRDEILMFLGAGLRAAAVRYFAPDEIELARHWVASASQTGAD